MSVRSCALAFLALATACSDRVPAPRGSAMDGPRAPMTLDTAVTKGQPVSGATMTFHVHVWHSSDWPVPIDVSINVPTDATLVAGPSHVTIKPDATHNDDTIDFAIQLANVPAADLVVVADSQSAVGGAHAETRYRFGRPEPKMIAPLHNGPPARTPRFEFGNSVPLE